MARIGELKSASESFNRRQFGQEIVVLCVRWYLSEAKLNQVGPEVVMAVQEEIHKQMEEAERLMQAPREMRRSDLWRRYTRRANGPPSNCSNADSPLVTYAKDHSSGVGPHFLGKGIRLNVPSR